MKLSFCFFTILAAGASAAHSDSHLHTPPQADASNAIDTQDLDEWLAATKRASPRALTACPSSCRETGNSSSGTGWFLFPDAASLAACNETMLLDLAVQNEVDGATSQGIRACTADYTSSMQASYEPHGQTAALCSTPNHALFEASVRMSHPPAGNDDAFAVRDLLSAGHQVINYFRSQRPSCVDNALAFGYSQSAVVGLFAGAEVHQHGVTTDVLYNLLDYAEKASVSKTTVVQLCQADGRGADYGIGIAASSAKNLPFVQEAVKTWAAGQCVSAAEGDEHWMTVTLRVPAPVESNSDDTETMALGSRSRIVTRAECKTTTVKADDGCRALADRCKITEAKLKEYNRRSNFCKTLVAGEKVCCSTGTLPATIPPGNSDGTCKTRQVIGSDTCGSLASKCGLTPQDFAKVNTGPKLCGTLKAGQHVCCTRGKMPDFRPKPNRDGSCNTYTTKTDDDCSMLAAAHNVTVANIEDFNKKTWGWTGCKVLPVKFKMCLSSGTPPMPAPVSNAICGPTVPGTKKPAKGTDLAKLNTCPLKVCCNVWGQCGTTDEFCTVSKSETGTPGVSSCGRDIVKGPPPSKKIHVAYFEAWNHKRKCLTMDVGQIDIDKYAHIHFAFADVTKDFKVDFKIYEGYVADQVPDQIDAFMGSGKADKYFKCTETKDMTCCSSCTYVFCWEDCNRSPDCKNGRGTVEIKCPTTLKDGSGNFIPIGEHIPNATYTLKDPKGFWKAIGDEYGIEESWIKFGRRHVRASNGCQYTDGDIQDCIDERDDWFYNYPTPGQVKVYNPKDLIGESYDKTKDLLSRLKIVRDNTEYDELMQWSDVVDAASLPALTTQTAVESMDKIVQTAKEIKKQEREEFIVSFLTGLLFFIPVVGDAAGAAGLTAARSLLRLAGAAGEAGLLLHDIIEHPENAFMSVFSYLAGAGVGRAGFRNAANARRAMRSSDIDSLGSLKKALDLIETVRGITCRI
ncbi:hypothetical protein CNMCM5793_003194 [Aspergillus hiratsukae]|uniref:LysM domain-containing protein n=1 Tax=Aspergillus hiratsukae TaxID=1194566 RepID=A0A8H6PEP1_9EURO|nr:hypothetical protein CNMCM5793_003194 [Aspergillus hiratsukae]